MAGIDIKTEIKGADIAIKMLDQLPDKLQRQTILKMLRKATPGMIREARSRLTSHGRQFSELAKSIGNITAKSPNPIIYIGPRVKGKWKYVGYIAPWVEYGTYGRKKGATYKPFPFMRPAIDAKTNDVKQRVTKSFADHLQQAVEKAALRLK